MKKLLSHLTLLLKTGGSQDTVLAAVLDAVLSHFLSETGTIHRLTAEPPQLPLLHLAAQKGLPPQLLDIVSTIPVGKGIAGQVVAQGCPVTMCNLQTDTSGVAKPGARQTGVGGALCVPIRRAGQIVGTLGIGTRREYEYTPAETTLLEEIGGLIGATWQPV